MTTVVDLSHVVEDRMTTYPGLPGPVLADHLTREQSREQYPAGTEFHIGSITMVANTGTYLDTPFHRFEEGTDLARTDLARLAHLPGVLVESSGGPEVRVEDFDGLDVAGKAVLVRTGWSVHWRTDHYGHATHPYLGQRAVDWLVSQRPALVGIDSVNIDCMADRTRPAHTGLLRAGIPIVEHLHNLHRLAAVDFHFHAAPVPVAGMGSFPVRAYAVLSDVGRSAA